MTVLVVSKFEPDDLRNIPRFLAGRRVLIGIFGTMTVALGLMTAGMAVLLQRHGSSAVLAAIPVVISWVFALAVIKNLIRPAPPAAGALERKATIMSPMRIELADDRLTIEMPVGRSTFSYDRFSLWHETAKAYYLIGKRLGGFVIPHRFVSPETAREVEAHLGARGVKIKRLDS